MYKFLLSTHLAGMFRVLKELRHGLCNLKKLAYFLKFVVRNPCKSSPSSTIFVGPVWLLITSLVFFYLRKLLFSGFLQFEGDFALRKNDLKYCDKLAPLRRDN